MCQFQKDARRNVNEELRAAQEELSEKHRKADNARARAEGKGKGRGRGRGKGRGKGSAAPPADADEIVDPALKRLRSERECDSDVEVKALIYRDKFKSVWLNSWRIAGLGRST